MLKKQESRLQLAYVPGNERFPKKWNIWHGFVKPYLNIAFWAFRGGMESGTVGMNLARDLECGTRGEFKSVKQNLNPR
jgi:hypothetical protein